MNQAAFEHQAAVGVDVGVREVRGEERPGPLHGGAEEQQRASPHEQLESGEEARAVVVEALLAASELADVAVSVEDREGVTLLEHPGAVVEALRRREDVEAVVDLEDLFRAQGSRASLHAPHPSTPSASAIRHAHSRVLQSTCRGGGRLARNLRGHG